MMESMVISGTPLAKTIKGEIQQQVQVLTEMGITPRMAVILASDDPAAASYAESKQKVAAALGIQMELFDLGQDVAQTKLEATVSQLSSDQKVHGILLELPLSAHLDADRAILKIDPMKDVDGLTPFNIGLVSLGREAEAILAATPQACIELAQTQGSLEGKRVGLVGRGKTVGRPLIPMLINRHATLTVCHTRTQNLAEVLDPCDVIIVAVGKPGLIQSQHLASHQVVIDAGINVVQGAIVGDVDTLGVRDKVKAISPVPGGVGPLTSAIIFRNLLLALQLQSHRGDSL